MYFKGYKLQIHSKNHYYFKDFYLSSREINLQSKEEQKESIIFVILS